MGVLIVFEGGRHDGRRFMWHNDRPPMIIETPEREDVADQLALYVAGEHDAIPTPSYRIATWRRQGRLDNQGAHVYRQSAP